MPLIAGQWTDAISQLSSENFFGAVPLFHNGNRALDYTELIINNDSTSLSVKPLEAELDAAYARFLLAQTTQQTTETAQQGLKDKIALAQSYALEIKSLFNIILEQYETNSNYPARYTAVKAVVDSFPNALKNRIHGGLLKDKGLDVLLIATDAQRGIYFDYVLGVSTTLALLLSQR